MSVLIAQINIDDSSDKTVSGTVTFDRANGGILVVPSGSSFPVSPVGGELFWRSDESKLYRRNSGNTAWEVTIAQPTIHSSTHGSAGTDPITVSQSQVTSLVTDLAAKELAANKNQASGYAGLDSGSKLTGSQQVYGSLVNTACQGNDSRLSDSRPPTGTASGDLTGTYPSPTIANLVVTDAKVAAANKDGLAATPSLRTLGTGAQQATAGNDSRLSDSRPPTGTASGDLTGTYPSPTIANLVVTDAKVAAANKDGLAATPSLRTLGTGAQQATAGNDSRLSDDRTASGLRTATTVVSTSASAAPTVGQTLVATGDSSATWQALQATLTFPAAITASGTITTTSNTYVLATGMTTTPVAGTYLVFFTGNAWQTNAGATFGVFMTIYAGGIQVVESENYLSDTSNFNTPFTCVAIISVNGTQAIEGRWRRSVTGAGTATMNNRRSLTLLRIG